MSDEVRLESQLPKPNFKHSSRSSKHSYNRKRITESFLKHTNNTIPQEEQQQLGRVLIYPDKSLAALKHQGIFLQHQFHQLQTLFVQLHQKSIIQATNANIRSQSVGRSSQSEYEALPLLKKQSKIYTQIIKDLHQQYHDYEFMLSGEYGDKVVIEINHTQQKIAKRKKQIYSLKRQLEKPLLASQTNDKLDRQVYLLEKQIREHVNANDLKKGQLKKLNESNSKKLEGKKRLQDVLQQADIDIDTVQKKSKNSQQYNQLWQKRQRILKIIESMMKTQLQLYTKKDQQLSKLHEVGQQIKESLLSIEETLKLSKKQLQKIKLKKKTVKRIHTETTQYNQVQSGSSRVHDTFVSRRRVYTQLQKSNYFSWNNQVAERQKQWLESIFQSRLAQESGQNLQQQSEVGGVSSRNRQKTVQREGGRIYSNTKAVELPPIRKNDIQLQLPRRQSYQGKIIRRKLDGPQKGKGTIVASSRYLTEQKQDNSNYHKLCSYLRKSRLDLEQSYEITDLIYQS